MILLCKVNLPRIRLLWRSLDHSNKSSRHLHRRSLSYRFKEGNLWLDSIKNLSAGEWPYLAKCFESKSDESLSLRRAHSRTAR